MKPTIGVEFRVVWEREGQHRKVRRYARREAAQRFMLLFGPEPWKAYAPIPDPDRFACCSGYECGCGGLTYRQQSEEKRASLPALKFMRLEVRAVGTWADCGSPTWGLPAVAQAAAIQEGVSAC